MPAPDRPKIYHIVHIENLAAIVADGYVLSDAVMAARGSRTVIGMGSIKQRRLHLPVGCHDDLFGNITWQDADRIRDLITTDIPSKVASDTAYQNAKQNSDKQKARIEHDKALGKVIIGLMKDDTELFKQFSDNPDFKRWLSDTVFQATYRGSAPPTA